MILVLFNPATGDFHTEGCIICKIDRPYGMAEIDILDFTKSYYFQKTPLEDYYYEESFRINWDVPEGVPLKVGQHYLKRNT